ncbi:lim domain protein [Pelomyxa schiedti]|nr:lim domain protein [Pelomyxa schiedti]
MFSLNCMKEHKHIWQALQSNKEGYESATIKMQSQSRNKSIDLARLAEIQQERDTKFALCTRYSQEAISESATLSNRTLATALLQICNTFDGFMESQKRSMQFLEDLKLDVQQWRQLASSKLAEGITQRRRSASFSAVSSPIPPFQETFTPTTRLSDEKWRRLVVREKEHCEGLKFVTDVYLANIMKAGSLFSEITREQVALIFCNIPQISEMHSQLLAAMQSASSTTSPFVEIMSTLFPLYSRYFANFVNSQHTLETCKTGSKVFSRLLKECQKEHPNIKSDLAGLLASPLNRLREYTLFFEVLAAESKQSGYEPDLQCFEALQTLNEFAETAKFTHQTALVSSKVVGWNDSFPVPPGRRFLMQAVVSSKESNSLVALLFSDALVIAKQTSAKSHKLQHFTTMNLQTMIIKLIPDISPTMKFCFQVIDHNTALGLSAGTDAVYQEIANQSAKAKQHAQQKKVFGVPLKDLMATKREEGHNVPSIVETTVTYLHTFLDQNACRVEGIFRLSGNQEETDNLLTKIESEEKMISFSGLDPHTVAGVLKRFVRNLPDPLITQELQPDFLKCGEEHDTEIRVRILKDLVTRLPKHHKYLLQYLTHFLWEITLYEQAKMNARNLSIVFAPHFLKNQDFTVPSLNTFSVIQASIENYADIFLEIEAQREEELNSVPPSPANTFTKTLTTNTEAPTPVEIFPSYEAQDNNGITISLREIVKQGTLFLKGRRTWNTRWFVLKKNYMYYFKTSKDHTAKGVINLQVCDIGPLEGSKRKYGFVVSTPSQKYLIAATNEAEYRAWITAINECKSPGTPSSPANPKHPPSPTLTPPLTPISGTTSNLRSLHSEDESEGALHSGGSLQQPMCSSPSLPPSPTTNPRHLIISPFPGSASASTQTAPSTPKAAGTTTLQSSTPATNSQASPTSHTQVVGTPPSTGTGGATASHSPDTYYTNTKVTTSHGN